MRHSKVPAVIFSGLVVLVLAAMLRGWGRLYFGSVISDLTEQFYLWRSFIGRWLSRGIVPYWNPHVFGGYPVIEMQQAFPLHPVAVLTALIADVRLGVVAWMAGLVALAGISSYIAFRYLFGLSGWAALVGSTAYVFGGVFATRIAAAHFTVVAPLAVWPFALGAVWKACRVGVHVVRWRAAEASARSDTAAWLSFLCAAMVANALVVLGGGQQYVVYLFYAQFVCALVAASWRAWRVWGATLGLSWVGGLALSAPQWLPTLFYLPYSSRAGASQMLPPAAVDLENFWIELLLPFPLGDDVLSPHLHLKNVWETAGYPGALVLALAGATILRAVLPAGGRDRTRHRAAAGVVLLGLYLCYGGWLPGFASFREAMKARALVALGLALAAALGTQDLLVWVRRRAGRLRIRPKGGTSTLRKVTFFDRAAIFIVCWVLAAVALVAWVAIAFHRDAVGQWLLRFGPPIDSLRAPAWQRAMANPRLLAEGLLDSIVQVTSCLVAAAIVLSALAWRPSRLLFYAAIALAVVEPYAVHFRAYVSRHPFAGVGLPGGFERAIRDEIERTRAERRPPWRVSLPPSLANRGHLVDGLWETGGYDPIMPWGANNRVMILPLTSDPHAGTAKRPSARDIGYAVGRRYDFTHWDPYEDLRRGLADAPFDLSTYEVAPDASVFSVETRVRCGTPRGYVFGPTLDGVHFVTEKPHVQSQSGAPEEPAAFCRKVEATGLNLLSPSDEPRRIPTENRETTAVIYPLGARPPHEYAFVVRTSTPALALLRMTWLPGWRAKVDDREWGRPWCANGWMLAVPVPAGVHKVEFTYRPVAWDASRAIALATACGILAIVALCARRRRASAFRQ